MKRTPKRMFIAVMMLVCMAAIATAQEVVIHGKGKLTAHGTGIADVHGDGKIEVAGAGTLVIKSSDPDKIEVEGFNLISHEGDLFFFQGQGNATVRGENIGLSLTGAVNKLKATGRGTALLKGHGKWRTLNDSGSWSDDGVNVKIEQ